MRTSTLTFVLLVSPSFGHSVVVWDTTDGAHPSSTVRASYENKLADDWSSIAAPIALSASADVRTLTVVGSHLKPSGGGWAPTDFSGSTYRVNAWSSLDAFAASPRSGDLFAGEGRVESVLPFASADNLVADTQLVRLALDDMALPAGGSIVGVQGLGLPLTLGAFYWSSTTSTAPLGARVRYTMTSGFETLPSSLALRLETQPVPEPASALALGMAALGALRRRKLAANR